MQNADNLEIVIKSPFVIKIKLQVKAFNILLTLQTAFCLNFLITSVLVLQNSKMLAPSEI